MMKKLLSLTLAMVTALGLMLPASAAEETTDEALARVTQAVKAALDLDTDAYDEFQGSWYEDGLTGAWTCTGRPDWRRTCPSPLWTTGP